MKLIHFLLSYLILFVTKLECNNNNINIGILEGPCNPSTLYYYANTDEMLSNTCIINCPSPSNYTIYGIEYWIQSQTRNVTACGSSKLDKNYINANDIKTELLSTNVIISSNAHINWLQEFVSISNYTLTLKSNQSITISSNLQNNGNIVVYV